MCDTEMREGYGDPLSLLKNCDAKTLGKLCEAVTSMADESMAYANFPKRSLVTQIPNLKAKNRVA